MTDIPSSGLVFADRDGFPVTAKWTCGATWA